jgi:hypothetical protein
VLSIEDKTSCPPPPTATPMVAASPTHPGDR